MSDQDLCYRIAYTLGYKTNAEIKDFFNTPLSRIRSMCFSHGELIVGARIAFIKDQVTVENYKASKDGNKALNRHVLDLVKSSEVEESLFKNMTDEQIKKYKNEKNKEAIKNLKNLIHGGKRSAGNT